MAVLDAPQPTAPAGPDAPTTPPGPPQPDPNVPDSPQGPPQPTENPNPEPPTTTDPSTDPNNPSPANPNNTSTGNDAFQQQLQALLAQLQSPTTTTKGVVHQPEVDAAKALYFKIWGVEPPHGYIEGLVHQGMNIYEIAANERAKPAFAQTQGYRDEWASLGQEVATIFGRR